MDGPVLAAALAHELPSARVRVEVALEEALLAAEDAPDVVVLRVTDPSDLVSVTTLRAAHPDTPIFAVADRRGRALAIDAVLAGANDYVLADPRDAGGLAASLSHRVNALLDSERALLVIDSPTCAVDADGRVVSVNEAWSAFARDNGEGLVGLGVGADYLAVCDASAAEHAVGAAAAAEGIRAVLAGALPRFELDYACHGPNEERWFSLRVSPRLGAAGAVLAHHDITALKLAERTRLRAGLRDPLTDLPNPALLVDRLDQALAEGSRLGRLVAVATIGLDRFTQVNGRVGREAGDAILVEVARRLALLVRDGDTLARFLGDRFVVVWRDLASAGEAEEHTARLAEAFHAPFVVAGAEVVLTATIGFSLDHWAQTAEELLELADAAGRAAQRSGSSLTPRSGLVRDDVRTRARTELSLRTAMERREPVVHYQPVIDLNLGMVVGVEALVRWEHPTDGLIAPQAFIPVAESGGLIVALGAWVLQEACQQAATWRRDGLRLEVAVNLSTRQVAHPDLLPTLRRVLRETGVRPAHLVLEVTETLVMEDAEVAADVLREIVTLGVSLTIDDFGTGYSSLVYLKRYPIAALKVDRSFVSGLGLNDDDDAIVASVVDLARAVGASCIAEGVETEDQLTALQDLRCGFAQGWLFGRAVPADQLPALFVRCEEQMAARLRDRAAHPDGAGGHLDRSGRRREQAASRRDLVADERDVAADRRDVVADERDLESDRRDELGTARDQAAKRRDRVATQRDEVGDKRDQVGDQRDSAAGKRDRAGDVRDEAGDQRDVAAELRDRQAGEPSAGAPRTGPVTSAQRAAADRLRASRERGIGAVERDYAEGQRETATADRSTEARERDDAEVERDVALAYRWADDDVRASAELNREVAHSDRAVEAVERTQAELERDKGQCTRLSP